MSRRTANNKKEVKGACCTHCKATGEPCYVYEGHNVRDARGLLCCPKIKSNVCYKCDTRGHLPGRCTGPKKTDTTKSTTAKSTTTTTTSNKPANNRFADFCESDSEEEVALTPVRVAPLVLPGAPVKAKIRASDMDWAADESDDEPASPPKKTKPRVKKTWAEMCDEEDEEDW
jgi:hypothetical protein